MMRIEKRGDVEYLVGTISRPSDCTAEHDGWYCNAHVNGEHIATSGPDGRRGERICARWPIDGGEERDGAQGTTEVLQQMRRILCDADPTDDTATLRRIGRLVHKALALVRAATSRSAEEIALEMVSEPMSVAIGNNTEWAVEIGIGDDRERVYFLTKDCSFYGADNIRSIIAAAIERDRAERQPTQPRDIAGRIRAMVLQKAGEWADTELVDTTSRAALGEIMRVLRLALADARGGVVPIRRIAWMREHMWGPGRTLIERAADELEAIVLEAGEQR